MEVSVTSCLHGYHIYQETWTPFIGEILNCGREEDNEHNRYTVAIYKSPEVVGHVPSMISHMCSSFIRRGGIINCTVIGNRRFSRDLEQGGMEIPCTYTFKGQPKEVEKVQKFFRGTLKTEVQVITSNNDEICNAAPAPDTVSTSTNASIQTEKRALDVEFTTETRGSDDKRFKPDVSQLMPSSSASLDLATGPTLIYKKDEATIKPMQETIDLTAVEHASSNVDANQIWVQFRRNTLKLEHKNLVENGCRLTDKHISFASSLISHQFPRISGLRTTLLQTSFPSGSIQAIFCRHREHWIVVSNMLKNDCIVL